MCQKSVNSSCNFLFFLQPFEDQMHGKVQEEIEKQKQVIRTLVSAYEQRASKAEMETKSLKVIDEF